MPKITQKQLIESLQAAGVQHVEVVEDETQSDFNVDDILSSIDKSRSAIILPQHEATMFEKANTGAMGRVIGTVASELSRTFGIPRAEIVKFADLKEMVSKSADLYTANLDKDKTALAKQLEEMGTAHQVAIEAKDSEWGDKYKKAQDRYIDRDIDAALVEALKDAPFLPTTDKTQAAKLLKNQLKGDYDLSYDEETKQVSLLQKGTKIAALNATNTSALKPFDKAKDIFEPLGMWQKDMRGINPTDAMRNNPAQPNNPSFNKNSGDPTLALMDAAYAHVQLPSLDRQ